MESLAFSLPSPIVLNSPKFAPVVDLAVFELAGDTTASDSAIVMGIILRKFIKSPFQNSAPTPVRRRQVTVRWRRGWGVGRSYTFFTVSSGTTRIRFCPRVFYIHANLKPFSVDRNLICHLSLLTGGVNLHFGEGHYHL